MLVQPVLDILVEEICPGQQGEHEQGQHQPDFPHSRRAELRRVDESEKGANFEYREQADDAKQPISPLVRSLTLVFVLAMSLLVLAVLLVRSLARPLVEPVRQPLCGHQLGFELSLEPAKSRHLQELVEKPRGQGSGKFFCLGLGQVQTNLTLDEPELLGVTSLIRVRFRSSDDTQEAAAPQPQQRWPRTHKLGGFEIYIAMPRRGGDDAKDGRFPGVGAPVACQAQLGQAGDGGHGALPSGSRHRRVPNPFVQCVHGPLDRPGEEPTAHGPV